MDSNCGMCQCSVTSMDYIPADLFGETCWCNIKEKFVPVEGSVCKYYVPSRKEKNNEN